MSNIDELGDIGRIERFQTLWKQREELTGWKLTQAEVDDLAAQCKVKSFKLHKAPSISVISSRRSERY